MESDVGSHPLEPHWAVHTVISSLKGDLSASTMIDPSRGATSMGFQVITHERG